jgi:two-component system cell cycle sensor histidine kinase/response regulator CckA
MIMQPIAVRRVRISVDKPGASAVADDPLVLLVTDDQDLRAVAVRALSAEGFRVATAAHAGHALLTCLSGDHISILVTELAMRDTTGPRLARRVRRYYPDLPVVYLADADAAESEGALVRPFTCDDLVGRLRSALAAVPV